MVPLDNRDVEPLLERVQLQSRVQRLVGDMFLSPRCIFLTNTPYEGYQILSWWRIGTGGRDSWKPSFGAFRFSCVCRVCACICVCRLGALLTNVFVGVAAIGVCLSMRAGVPRPHHGCGRGRV